MARSLPSTGKSGLALQDKDLLTNFPGESEVVLELRMSVGDPRTLRLGPLLQGRVHPTPRAELEQVLGLAALTV